MIIPTEIKKICGKMPLSFKKRIEVPKEFPQNCLVISD